VRGEVSSGNGARGLFEKVRRVGERHSGGGG